MNLDVQWATLLWMITSGGILGIIFDSYRVVSGELRFPRWSVHALDLVYWLAASLFVFRMLYHSNQGELRFYVFLGLFVGVWFYFLFLSVIIERFVVMLMRIVGKIFVITQNLTHLLIVAPLLWIYRLCKIMLGFVWAIIQFLWKITILPIWKIIVWVFRPVLDKLGILVLMMRMRDLILAFCNKCKNWFKE